MDSSRVCNQLYKCVFNNHLWTRPSSSSRSKCIYTKSSSRPNLKEKITVSTKPQFSSLHLHNRIWWSNWNRTSNKTSTIWRGCRSRHSTLIHSSSSSNKKVRHHSDWSILKERWYQWLPWILNQQQEVQTSSRPVSKCKRS